MQDLSLDYNERILKPIKESLLKAWKTTNLKHIYKEKRRMDKSVSVSFNNFDENPFDDDSKIENDFEERRQSVKISKPNKSKY